MIKVDRTFVSDLAEGTEHVVIVQAVVSIARALGMTTTAEGVETEAQKEFLTALGCDEAQGYLFSEPVPVERVPTSLPPGRHRQHWLRNPTRHSRIMCGESRRGASDARTRLVARRGREIRALSHRIPARNCDGRPPLSCQSRNSPDATTMAEPTSSPTVGTSPHAKQSR